jgi:hypothetical protein
MIWRLKELMNFCHSNSVEVSPGKWIPARPINYQFRSLKDRIKESWMVFVGKAEVFVWPEDQ